MGRGRPNHSQFDGTHAAAAQVVPLVDDGLRLHSCPLVGERSERVERLRMVASCASADSVAVAGWQSSELVPSELA